MSDTPETPETQDPATQPVDTKVARADALRQAADDASRLVRTLVVTFLLVGVYVAIIVFGTTDVQLLKETPVRLPFFEVGVPLVGFYAVVPWVVVLLHFNMLLQLTLLSRKLHAFNAAVREIDDPRARRDQRDRLYAFPFSDMLAGRHDSALLRTLLAGIVWSTVLILPLALLIAAQVRFLPYRSDPVTVSQGLAVLATLAALWALWPVAVTGRSWREWRSWAVGFVTVGEVVAARRSQLGGRRSRPKAARRWRRRFRDGSMRHSLLSLGLATLVVAAPTLMMATGIARDGWFRTYLVFPEAVLVRGEPPVEVVTALRSDDPEARSAALDRVLGLDLRGRDLSEAIFDRAVLPKADLRWAKLTEAKLKAATLTAADLRGATLNGADLSVATLTGADLSRATLTEAGLAFAKLNGANLSYSTLIGADLRYVTLPNANLQKARLTQANLASAKLTEADLHSARLNSANLRYAIINKANLREAKLSEADLRGARLTKADLREAELTKAKLVLARLDGANLRGAILIKAGLQYASLIEADLIGAWLTQANLRRARLDRADLRFAVLTEADLSGATLADVKLDFSTLTRVTTGNPAYVSDNGEGERFTDFKGAQMYNTRLDGADLRAAKFDQKTLDGSCGRKVRLPDALEVGRRACKTSIPSDVLFDFLEDLIPDTGR